MRSYSRIVAWFAAAVAGVLVWNLIPDLRPIISWLIVASLICYLVSILVGMTVKRVMSAEQLELHSRLDLLDRKLNALLKEALEQRRPR
ncbi:MAG: hypothetical protein ABW175_14910 [Bradyrhizobium sp.]